MPLNLDAYLGVHQDALKVYARRTAVLANNLANADTPNFKAQDLDFKKLLSNGGTTAVPASGLATTQVRHISSASVLPAVRGSRSLPRSTIRGRAPASSRRCARRSGDSTC